ncbi:MAG: methyltransferase domain-containing protein [Planctomycetota bacterium]
MRLDSDLLNLLCCPSCGGDLGLAGTPEMDPDGHAMTGELRCRSCGAAYPIRRGIPRFVPDVQEREVSATVTGFGYEWCHVNAQIEDNLFNATGTFLDFLQPVQPEYFQGRVVLDAGCGNGRFSYWSQRFGAKTVVGVDLSDSVEAAFHNTRMFPNVLILQADLLALPFKSAFDYAFSVGVLHHTADPRRSFDSMVRRVKPGGGVSAWVYGRENNDWIIRYVNPVRKHVTSRLPRCLLRVVTLLLTVPLYAVTKGIYRPVGRWNLLRGLRKRLFYFDYLYFFGAFGIREQFLEIFDHLVPAIAEYIPRDEFAEWYSANELEGVTITARLGNSWRGFGTQPQVATMTRDIATEIPECPACETPAAIAS